MPKIIKTTKALIKRGIPILILTMLLAHASGAGAITLSEEEKISKKFLEAVFQQFEVIDDPVIAGEVRKVGQKILAAMPPQPLTYHFYVLRRDEYNAFAGPGGHVFIFSGLLAAMDSESELAGILAHEIGHVANRHISQKIEKSGKVNLIAMAGMLAGVLLGAGGAASASQAVIAGSAATSQAMMLAFSRQEELEADNSGIKYMVAAGFNPEGSLKVLKKLREKEWFGTDQIPTYLRTHPAVEDRIGFIGTWIAHHPEAHGKKADNGFKLVITRLKALYGNRELSRREFQNRLAADPRDAMAHYGLALMAAEDGTLDIAIEHIKKALTQDAFNTALLTDLGRIYFLNGDYQQAKNTLNATLAFGDFNPVSYLFMARTQMALGEDQQALKTFQTLLSRRPDYHLADYHMAEVYGKLGQTDMSHYYLGRYYQNQKRYKTAIFHFEKALAATTDTKRKDEIKSILKELNGLHRQAQQKEAQEKASS